MGGLTLQTEEPSNITMISNTFIDEYMGRANGEFVKVYLYLVRCADRLPDDFSLGSIADRLYMTEGDVARALHYWEQEGLLRIRRDSDGSPAGLTLRSMEQAGRQRPAHCGEAAAALEPGAPSAGTPQAFLYTSRGQKAQGGIPPEDTVMQEITLLAEQYLGRTLTAVDVDRIAFFYKELHFSPDLIEYLFEHCVTIGNRSMRYIESVAIAWRDKQITTVEQAKAEGAHYRREYYQILKAFGVTSRTPIENEITYMKRWLDEYHFTVEVISEACQRTVAKTGNVSFPYAESILKNWKEHGILARKDIAALDEAHYARRREQEASAKSKAPRSGSRFNNFEERSYDFDQLERALNNVPT